MLFRCLFGILFLLSFVTVRSADVDSSNVYKNIERPKLKDIPMYYKGQEYRCKLHKRSHEYVSPSEIFKICGGGWEERKNEFLSATVKCGVEEETLAGKSVYPVVYINVDGVDVPYFDGLSSISDCFTPSKLIFEDCLISFDGELKLVSSDGNSFRTFKNLDLSIYILVSHVFLPSIARYPKIVNSFSIIVFYCSLFGMIEDEEVVCSIESYVIYDGKSESKFANNSWLLGSDDIKRIIDALKAGKSVDIICKKYNWKNELMPCQYNWKNDLMACKFLFGKEFIDKIHEIIIKKIKYCSNLKSVSDLKRCISCLFGIDSSDVIVYKFVEGEGEEGEEGQYTILNDNDEICHCTIDFSEKYKCVDYLIRFYKDIKNFGEEQLRLDIKSTFGKDKITFNYCDVSDEESFKNALKKEFAFLKNVDFKLEFHDADDDLIDFDRDKVNLVDIFITSPSDICVNNTETKTIKIKLIGGHFWGESEDESEIEIPVSTVSYSDIIAGLKKTMDLKFGKGAGEKFHYKLFIDGEPVEFLSTGRVINKARDKNFMVYIEDDDFVNMLKGVVVSGKKGNGTDSVQKGCCKCQSCRKNRVK